ncbi:uncharacterized protein [Epargyreus clarus]|uniref:uncharacterized protein n=1 Tax=Epargyreus clarus TaxID=520877 RepID=UPI003C2E7695
MEPSKEAIAVRITRLNPQIIGKVTSGTTKLIRKTIDREALLDALTVLYDECNEDPVKKCDELVRAFVDKYRSTLAELRRARVCLSDFEFVQTIGRGHFGEVHMVREKQTGDVYALKSVRKEQARRRVAGAGDERDVLATANGPWIPHLQYAFQDSSMLYLVMELCNGGDLAGFMARRNHPLPERDAAFYVAEIAHALKALHGMGYVHRDIKPHNILLDRCGHVKLGDFGSCARLAEAGAGAADGTPDYVAPELLAAAACAADHAVCFQCCRDVSTVTTAISACDYWSLGVVAFELVTLTRPFSSGEDDTIAQILSNIQRYERDPNAEPPFDPLPNGPTREWRSLVAGLLRVQPGKRYNYLDTLQHAAMQHLHIHNIREQAPPWVPHLRGAEDTAHLPAPPRVASPPSAAPFRTRAPFAGQLPFVGYSYVAPDESEDSSGGFNTTHDCTAIDLATFKSAEKLAAMRGREIASLQSKLAAAEAAGGAAAERARRDADADAERMRARLQAEITALTLQNKRLERQIEVEKEERMALQRTNQELSTNVAERNSAEVRAVHAQAAELQAEKALLRDQLTRLESRVAELQAECSSALASADSARAQHKHYKDVVQQVQDLRHRWLTEINVKPIDTIAKERALRRQTMSSGDVESARVAAAEALAADEARARRLADTRLAAADTAAAQLREHVEDLKAQLNTTQESVLNKQREVDTLNQQLGETQAQLAQERVRAAALDAHAQELERCVRAAGQREAALEEQCARTESRLLQRLDDAEARAAAALHDDCRHRDKVKTLEQLVRQLERDVSALENRACTTCVARERDNPNTSRSTEGAELSAAEGEARLDTRSDTESVADTVHVNAQVSVLKEQLERAEAQLQARTEEIAALRQEARAANLARWRKEKEFNDLSLDSKVTTRDLKRAEERITTLSEARKVADEKASKLQSELSTLKPQYEQIKAEAARSKEQFERLQKSYEILQAEVERSRNDIRKLRSELMYSEKRRMHAEEQEELSARERSQLRDELLPLRAQNNDLMQVGETTTTIITPIPNRRKNFKETSFKSTPRRDKPCPWPKPAYLRPGGAWAKRVRLALAADLLRGRCGAVDAALSAFHAQLTMNNKALQEACSLLEEQLTDLEKLADFHELKNKDLESELQRVRAELDECRTQLAEAERRGAERAAAASLADQRAADLQDALRQANTQLELLQERVESRESLVSELEARAASLGGALAGREAALGGAARRVRELQEECAALATRAQQHHAHALQLQAALADAQEEVAAAREAAAAAAAWWRARETRADATLRQQAKLIDFLQVKVEEANRKKCSLSNKLFGRSGRRTAASPPLLRVNRELREEVDRLRAKLAASNAESSFPPTPRRERTTEKPKKIANVIESIDTPDSDDDNSLLIIWPDGNRERMQVRHSSDVLILNSGSTELRARLLSPEATNLPHNEANRAFTIKLERSGTGAEQAAAVCGGLAQRARWLARLAPPPRAGYEPALLAACAAEPLTAYFLAPDAVAIGCSDGLHSQRGPVQLECAEASPRGAAGVRGAAAAAGRALLLRGAALAHGGLRAAASALRRVATLQPRLALTRVHLPDDTPPDLLTAIVEDVSEGICVAVACGRRVFLLRFDASNTDFKVARSLTVDRPPASLLLTSKALYIAGEKPLKINLPSGALEAFAMDEPTVAAASKKHSPPKAIVLIGMNPIEILLCYTECGIFVDENGKRTRNEEPKWSSAVHGWEFVSPFLYAVGEDRVTIIHISEEAYRAPPCTCDTTSLASSASECYSPEIFNYKVKEPALLGTAPNGIIIRTKTDEGYNVLVVEGMAAFRSIGTSLESLDTISDSKGSSSDLGQSMTDLSPQDISNESVQVTTGFLADIRSRAQQIRTKNRHNMQTSDDVIKEILTTEVGIKRSLNGRKSPESTSEFDSDTEQESEEATASTKCTADVCAEMFTRQVRFQ